MYTPGKTNLDFPRWLYVVMMPVLVVSVLLKRFVNLKLVLLILLFLMIYFMGAVSHEAGLSRNFNKTGDAKAWFFDLKR